mmetsp:Transcript_9103/g.38265  ORF Transcript_9103/g.38265 Transcript_9103/m.38265 type:complete len:341 (+) Transcript_9103:158-1180(+)
MRSARAPAGSSARRVSLVTCAAGPPATTHGTGARCGRTRSAPKKSTKPASRRRPRATRQTTRLRLGALGSREALPGTDSRSNADWPCTGAGARADDRSVRGKRTARDCCSRARARRGRRTKTFRPRERKKTMTTTTTFRSLPRRARRTSRRFARLPCLVKTRPPRPRRTGVVWRRTRGTRSVSRSYAGGAGPFPWALRGGAAAGARRCGAPRRAQSRTTRRTTRRSSCGSRARPTDLRRLKRPEPRSRRSSASVANPRVERTRTQRRFFGQPRSPPAPSPSTRRWLTNPAEPSRRRRSFWQQGKTYKTTQKKQKRQKKRFSCLSGFPPPRARRRSVYAKK